MKALDVRNSEMAIKIVSGMVVFDILQFIWLICVFFVEKIAKSQNKNRLSTENCTHLEDHSVVNLKIIK